MKFDTKNEGTWFYFDESNPDDGGVCLRVCAKTNLDWISERTSKTKKVFKDGYRYVYKDTDEKKSDGMLWDFCIVDWKDVDVDGAILECTYENKIKLMNSCIAFVTFVGKRMKQLAELDRMHGFIAVHQTIVKIHQSRPGRKPQQQQGNTCTHCGAQDHPP